MIANHGDYRQAVEATSRAAVERIIGREVTSFASVTKVHPHYAVEIFRAGAALGPPGRPPVAR